ncbi:hypothetical protein PVAP13_7NG380350 [Panicum virgatum]|uniref:Uncharacterized protein n=1 Tax=Panicum virgatum TaxID=38727 RepID=A0A8T0Q363_PANVG|nr:hypothetical protein PVAP13_7NG380350 [Panicum virgatum]
MPPHHVLHSKSDPEARGRLRVFPDLACIAGVTGTGQAGRRLSFGSSEPSGGGGAKGAGAARLADGSGVQIWLRRRRRAGQKSVLSIRRSMRLDACPSRPSSSAPYGTFSLPWC